MSNFVAETAKLGRGCTIGHNVVILDRVQIGDNVYIGHNVVIHEDTKVGNGTFIDDGSILGRVPRSGALSRRKAPKDLPRWR
jgi:UDP-3-O-[3-hydroxymyristoyl] glucosamine N-acyltransferase